MSDYDERRAREREEQRRYENDVFYDVWRSGGNVDRINDERVSDSYYDGRSAESAARRELQAQRPKREEEYPEEQWPEEQFPPGEEAGEETPRSDDGSSPTGAGSPDRGIPVTKNEDANSL